MACTTSVVHAQAINYCASANKAALFLIDRTTAFDDYDRAYLQDSLPAIDKSLAFRTRVILHTISDDFSRSQKLFDECVPGCPPSAFPGMSTCFEAKASAERQDMRRRFFRLLHSLAQKPEQASKSDIARTIVEASRTYGASSTPVADLIVFSDLIDNVIVPHKGIYQQDPGQTLKNALKQQIKANLRGANVAVFGFGRVDSLPRHALPPNELERLRSFWTNWFKESGASNVELGVRLVTR